MRNKDLVKQAIDYLRSLPNKDDAKEEDKPTKIPAFEAEHVEQIFDLKIPKGEGAEQVRSIFELLADYAEDDGATNPISIAIFGPPGSGKSTLVKQLSKNVDGIDLVKTANMTQVNNAEEVADAFKTMLLSMRDTTDIPMVFFDEFDTTRDGAPLGWLSWFLAPMEDGVVLAQGQEVKIGKAVFVFAGGTAETLDEFSRRAKRNPENYRARKVPDFISRLRGTINIGGINGYGKDRVIRRALALSFNVDGKRATSLDNKDKLRPLLEKGHFVHGVRSLKTVLRAEQATGGLDDMEPVIRRQHYSRGEFDGLTIGISAGLKREDGSQGLTVPLTKRLVQHGASIAYAGAFFKDGTLDAIVEAAKMATSNLFQEGERRSRIVNYLGYPASLKAPSGEPGVFDVRKLETISEKELEALGAPVKGDFDAFPQDTSSYNPAHHAAWAISQFRLRVRFVQDIDALVVCGGNDDGTSWGRMSGIAEEVLIAVALGKPIYVLGKPGGAAEAVGKLLGLGDAPASLSACITPPTGTVMDKLLEKHGGDFRIPGVKGSPVSLSQTRKYLYNRGLSTTHWRDNGLSIEENREVFDMWVETKDEVSAAIRLILTGLSRVDWKFAR